MNKRFKVEVVIKNGEMHYKVMDILNNNIIHCNSNELNETIYKLLHA